MFWAKFSWKIFLSALLQIVEKQKQEKTYDEAAKPRCVFRLIIKVAKQGKKSPKNSCSTALKGKKTALNGFFCKEKRISSIFREKSLDFFAPCHYNYLCYFVLSNKYKPLPDGGWEGYRWLKSESKTTNLWRAHSDALRSSAQERALFRKFARERLTKSLPLSARRSPKQLASASTNNQTWRSGLFARFFV